MINFHRVEAGCWSCANFEAAPKLFSIKTKLRLQSYLKLTAMAPAVLCLTALDCLSLKQDQLYIPKYRTKRLQRSIKYWGAKTWNDISCDVRRKSYQNYIRTHWNSYFYNNSPIQLAHSTHGWNCWVWVFVSFVIAYWRWLTPVNGR